MTGPAKPQVSGGVKATQGTRRPKRFYKEVAIRAEDGRVSVLLDGKPIRTPAKAPLALPNAALAEAVAQEWRAQRERIEPETMPLTKLANSAIDGVRGREQAVIDDILAFAGADLVCYRAAGRDELVALQGQHWNPVLAFAKDDLAASLKLGRGVAHIEQPPASLDRIKRRLEDFDAFGLAALHVMTTLTGSAMLALGVALGRLSPEEAWEAANVDEDWQIGQWGEDAEAAERRARRWSEFEAASRMLSLRNGGKAQAS
jgi:chaperone required for assembly of F1-ATPase